MKKKDRKDHGFLVILISFIFALIVIGFVTLSLEGDIEELGQVVCEYSFGEDQTRFVKYQGGVIECEPIEKMEYFGDIKITKVIK